MTIIWGTNYALVKSAFPEFDPQAFNAIRLVEASAVMVGANLLVRRARPRGQGADAGGEIASIFHTPAPVTRADWIRLTWLGLIGHCLYQYLFVGGLAKTSVANGRSSSRPRRSSSRCSHGCRARSALARSTGPARCCRWRA